MYLLSLFYSSLNCRCYQCCILISTIISLVQLQKCILDNIRVDELIVGLYYLSTLCKKIPHILWLKNISWLCCISEKSRWVYCLGSQGQNQGVSWTGLVPSLWCCWEVVEPLQDGWVGKIVSLGLHVSIPVSFNLCLLATIKVNM